MMSPPKKSNTGLIVIIALVVVVLIGGGVVAAIALNSGKKNPTANNNPNNPSSTQTAGKTPTPIIPAGFKQYNDKIYSIAYPNDWQVDSTNSAEDEVVFSGPDDQTFQVYTMEGASEGDEETYNQSFCSAANSDATLGSSVNITIGGATWKQLDCQSDGTLHVVIESVVHNGLLYIISYFSISDSFNSGRSTYFVPMEQSFAFVG
jgi:hypothetical protein